MEIKTKTQMTIIIELTETEAGAAISDGTDLRKAIQRAIIISKLPDGAPVARRKKVTGNKRHVGARSPRPKAKTTMTCTTCGKVYKQPASFKRHVSKHIAMPADAS